MIDAISRLTATDSGISAAISLYFGCSGQQRKALPPEQEQVETHILIAGRGGNPSPAIGGQQPWWQ